MVDPSSRTHHEDAPPSTLKHRSERARAPEAPEAPEGFELVGRTVTINRPRQELYEFWREFSNLQTFMQNVRSVHSADPVRSHWVIGVAAEDNVEWDSIVTEDVPNEIIAWRAAEGSTLQSEGRVEFRDAPGGRGTQVKATIRYDSPGGALGKLIAQLFHRDPKTQARRELRRFKQLMETGEISTAEPPDSTP